MIVMLTRQEVRNRGWSLTMMHSLLYPPDDFVGAQSWYSLTRVEMLESDPAVAARLAQTLESRLVGRTRPEGLTRNQWKTKKERVRNRKTRSEQAAERREQEEAERRSFDVTKSIMSQYPERGGPLFQR